MHMVGYFEGIDSERGIVRRCFNSFSLRDFFWLANRDKVPDHSWVETRSRLPHEVHVSFGWVRPWWPIVAAEGRADRRRRFNDGGQRRAANYRAPRQWRDLSPDADAHGQREA